MNPMIDAYRQVSTMNGWHWNSIGVETTDVLNSRTEQEESEMADSAKTGNDKDVSR